MQGDPVPLLRAINQLTTLEYLGLDLDELEGEQPPVHGEGRPVVQLRLPRVRHLAAFMAVQGMDVRACPLLERCRFNLTPSRALEAIIPVGLPPAEVEDEEEEAWALQEVWWDNPGPYSSCPQDGIVFAREGAWSYDQCEDGLFEPRYRSSHWRWAPAE